MPYHLIHIYRKNLFPWGVQGGIYQQLYDFIPIFYGFTIIGFLKGKSLLDLFCYRRDDIGRTDNSVQLHSFFFKFSSVFGPCQRRMTDLGKFVFPASFR